MSQESMVLEKEQIASIEKNLVDLAKSDQEAAEANQHLLGKTAEWSVDGDMATSGIGYMYIGGNFKPVRGKTLHFEGHTGGAAAGGGWGIGKAVFYVSVDELLKKSVFVEVKSANIIGGGIHVTWSRNFKKLGFFIGGGMGVGGGVSFGSGKFSLQ